MAHSSRYRTHSLTLAQPYDQFVPQGLATTTLAAPAQDNEGKTREVTVVDDDGIRPGTTAGSLAKLKPAFAATGSTTAGNSSQVTGGNAPAH